MTGYLSNRLNRNTAIMVAILVVGVIILYWLARRPSSLDQKVWDVNSLPAAPEGTEEEMAALVAERVTITVVVKGKKLDIYSLQIQPKKSGASTVLLLHGLGDSSHNWVQVNTLQLLAFWGYRAIAVDLPGYGKSQEALLGHISREEFLMALVDKLGPDLPVIVAPSMAGSFAIPYLFKSPESSMERAAAFIAVAPTSTEAFSQEYPHSQLWTLVLYGEQDQHLGKVSREMLNELPNANIVVLPDAGHACFKDQPVLFNRALYHYLRYVRF
ncbi:putative protein-lysine deacylase ABHD14B [Babylonia areolata]|uniref:putative protein-lysine deacylase ABHD14B n=1 Tax=Babylonia areolata TaxID=304850 RepID=UPI003FD42464